MKRFLVILSALCVVVSMTALAEEAAPAMAADAAVAAAPAADLTLTGKIAKVEPKMEGGKATYELVSKDGKIALPETADVVKMVGKEVKIVAKGTEKKDGDKKVVKVDSIVKVEEAVAAPAVTK